MPLGPDDPVFLFAAGFDDRAIRQDEFQADHMVGGDPVGEGVRAAGVFGDVAADGAGALAGGVRCVEVFLSLRSQGEIEIDHSRLDHRALVRVVELQNAIHPGETDDNSA